MKVSESQSVCSSSTWHEEISTTVVVMPAENEFRWRSANIQRHFHSPALK